jgi:hypothetical protein
VEVVEWRVDRHLQCSRIVTGNFGFHGLECLLSRSSIDVPFREIEIVLGMSPMPSAFRGIESYLSVSWNAATAKRLQTAIFNLFRINRVQEHSIVDLLISY